MTRSERESWVELAALVEPMRVATAADVPAFRLMVQAVAIVADARAALNAGGSLITEEVTKSGVMVKPRPELQIIEKFQKLAMYHLARWGLSPADRSRVSALSEETGPDPLAEFGLEKLHGG